MNLNLPKSAIAAFGLAVAGTMSLQAELKADFPMDVAGGITREQISGQTFNVNGNIGAMQIKGLDGHAWRTDGYTTFINAQLGKIIDGDKMTAKVAFAIDTNAIVGHDREGANNEWAKFVDCLNGDSGFSFMLGRSGQFAFRTFVGGREVTLASDVDTADGKLQLWQWNELTGTVDGNRVSLYLNGRLVKETTVSGTGVKVEGEMRIGRDNVHNDLYALARQADFNGAIDYIRISDTAEAPAYTPQYADLNLPGDRYKNDKLRARFHGQPGMNWTNETHGLLYNEKDGKYHLIFQRTGSAPVMSHAHYGHIVSEDLINWRDDKPMIWPSENYDRRGCWSGCIFSDEQINGGKPSIIYTGVGYGQTSHANIAYCDDDVNLRTWHKPNDVNPIRTYGNVARDTYFFRTDADHAYFIIGDEGCMRSYRYQNGNWVDNGNFYDFQSGESGFTEMPNVSKLPNGKWLMTYTPYTGNVQCIYRIGDIDSNGKFVNFTESRLFDFYANDGYCLMSPTIGKDKKGNLVALGIVADKMPTEWNIEKGYAHLYSLPRQLGVDSEGRLTQKPFDGFEKMRGSVTKSIREEKINGKVSLNPVRGRQAEVSVTFTVGDAGFGLDFLKNTKGKGGSLTYNPATQELILDIADIVPGNYGFKNRSFRLPVAPAKGEELKMHLFIDHSVADIFINDRYASSFRVFPENMDHDLIEVFSNGETMVKELDAYLLGEGDMSENPIEPYVFKLPENSGKVAFVKSASNVSAQEGAALDFFRRAVKNGRELTTSEAASINGNDFDCVWIHIDRIGLEKGCGNLPSEFLSEELTEALKGFVDGGGNLMLTGHATQLLQKIGRVAPAYAPNEFNSGAGADGNDEWTVNAAFAGDDHNGHAIYKNLQESDAFPHVTYGLLYGGGSPILREDHNCMWNFENLTYKSAAETFVKRFEEDNHASVIGTWGQETAGNFGGIIEFYPLKATSGTVMANGLAACQWSIANGSNADVQNLELLTANMIAYLASATGERPCNPGGGEIVVPEDPETPETLDSTGKVGLYVGYPSSVQLLSSGNKEEIAVYNFFLESYPASNVIYSGENGRISTDEFDCIWVNLDRYDIGSGSVNLPEGFNSTEFINALRDYNAAGGNLYLTKHASHLAYEIGRARTAPNEVGSGQGGWNDGKWHANVCNNGNDWTSHLIFSDLSFEENYGMQMLLLFSGNALRDDHNVMWNMNVLGGHDTFTKDNNARVLGTWGHNDGDAMWFAGIVEFLPVSGNLRAISEEKVNERKGTIITNGIAAYEWAPREGTNESQANIRKLSSNILMYLSPKAEDKGNLTGVDEPGSETDGNVYVSGHELRYSGFAAGSELTLFASDGRMLLKRSVEGEGSISVDYDGVVIVVSNSLSIGNRKTSKFILK